MSDKQKYQLEYVVKASPKLLFNFISSPSGLSEWFADNVNSRGEKYTFFWDDSEEVAQMVSKKANQHIRFKWESSEDDETYFEFTIVIDDLTFNLVSKPPPAHCRIKTVLLFSPIVRRRSARYPRPGTLGPTLTRPRPVP
jgi:uncharacterized protein YndB with AHSA1/START domain